MIKYVPAKNVLIGDFIQSGPHVVKVINVQAPDGHTITLTTADNMKYTFRENDKIGIEDYGNTDDY